MYCYMVLSVLDMLLSVLLQGTVCIDLGVLSVLLHGTECTASGYLVYCYMSLRVLVFVLRLLLQGTEFKASGY